MAFELTEAQRRAVETRDKTILLSAAAGSGKTATLTRRIIEQITDSENPLDLSRMLIVTFTRAAAAELRERISAALTGALADNPANKHLNRQTVVLGSAEICTIDSFCLDIVRANFQHLTSVDGMPLSHDFRLADDTELKAIRFSVMNSVIDSWYEKKADGFDFSRFVDCFSIVRGEGTFVEQLLQFACSLADYPDPNGFTLTCANRMRDEAKRDFFDTSAGKIIQSHIIEWFEYYRDIAEQAAYLFADGGIGEKNYTPAFASDAKFFNTCIGELRESYERAFSAITSYSSIRLSSLGKSKDSTSENYKNLRTAYKKKLQSITKKYFAIDSEKISMLAEKTADELETLAAVINDYNREYAREKSVRRICEFSDIKRLAHKLLVNENGLPTEAALELRARYDAVYIDEYQDVDHIQDEIFSAVSREGCRFVVGDIKQSIYSFRGAEPSIFGAMRKSLPDFGTDSAEKYHACSLFMSENFRCDTPIVDFVNRVSRHTFVPAGGTVGYRAEDDLVCGKCNPGAAPVTVAVFPKSSETDEDDEEQSDELLPEIEYIVKEIERLVREAVKNDRTPVKRSDIAVLCRDGGYIAKIATALAKVGIDTVDETAKDFFGNPEILLVLSLVSAIDNPEKDITLAAVLRSPFFGFTMDDMVRIRRQSDSSYSLCASLEAYAESEIADSLTEKCAAFIEKLTELRIDARNMPVDRFVRQLYRDFGIMSLSASDDNRTPAQISANLRRFYDYSRRYTANQNGGLTGFIRYINGIIETGGRVDVPGTASPDGAVTLMTIHKSKGLEFPVVFVCGCGKQFNRNDLKNTIISHSDFGIALKLIDDTGFAKTDTPQRTALTVVKNQNLCEEEMRILYVALTRARERLYITASTSSDIDMLIENVRFSSDFERRISVLSAKCFLDWILPAVSRDSSCFKLITALNNSPKSIESSTVDSHECESRKEKTEQLRSVLRERFLYVYPHSAAEKLPAKISVSRLYPEVLDDDGAAGLDSESLPELRGVPLFLQEKASSSTHTAAERGTATHVFLQFCDFGRAAKNIRGELDRLVAKRYIPGRTAELVNIRQLEMFFNSELYRLVSSAPQIWREQRFNLLLPAENFTADKNLAGKLKNENLLVQGVIDLFFIDSDGRVILCDYKTDFLTSEEIQNEALAKKKLSERHATQLGYYAAAVSRMLGRAPDSVCIYSLPLGKALEIQTDKI